VRGQVHASMRHEMPERAPTPERLAELYHLLDPWGPGDDLHLAW